MVRGVWLGCVVVGMLAWAGCASSRQAGAGATDVVLTYTQPALSGTPLELASVDGPGAASFRHHATGGTFQVDKGQPLPARTASGAQYFLKSTDLPAGKVTLEVRESD
jgi:hypothetical protein